MIDGMAALPALAPAYSRVTYVDTSAFMNTLHRQRLYLGNDGRMKKVSARIWYTSASAWTTCARATDNAAWRRMGTYDRERCKERISAIAAWPARAASAGARSPLNPGPVAALAPHHFVSLLEGALAFAILAFLLLLAVALLHWVLRSNGRAWRKGRRDAQRKTPYRRNQNEHIGFFLICPSTSTPAKAPICRMQ
jgi:hypothetical protein